MEVHLKTSLSGAAGLNSSGLKHFPAVIKEK